MTVICRTGEVKADTMHISNYSKSSVLHLEMNKLFSREAYHVTATCSGLAARLMPTLGKTHLIATGDLLR